MPLRERKEGKLNSKGEICCCSLKVKMRREMNLPKLKCPRRLMQALLKKFKIDCVTQGLRPMQASRPCVAERQNIFGRIQLPRRLTCGVISCMQWDVPGAYMIQGLLSQRCIYRGILLLAAAVKVVLLVLRVCDSSTCSIFLTQLLLLLLLQSHFGRCCCCQAFLLSAAAATVNIWNYCPGSRAMNNISAAEICRNLCRSKLCQLKPVEQHNNSSIWANSNIGAEAEQQQQLIADSNSSMALRPSNKIVSLLFAMPPSFFSISHFTGSLLQFFFLQQQEMHFRNSPDYNSAVCFHLSAKGTKACAGFLRDISSVRRAEIACQEDVLRS